MRKPALALLAALLGSAAGCVTLGPAGHEPAVTGRLVLAGPTFGERELVPVRCDSGQRQVFLGVDFASGETGLVARLAVDPIDGPAVKIFEAGAPFGPALLLRQRDCAAFHFSLARSGWRINDFDVLRVTLQLDCSLPAGDSVKGELAAPSCW